MNDFTKDELERMNVVQLKRVAEFLGVGLEYRMKKGDIIEKILEAQGSQLSFVDVVDKEEQKSVRIKRIEELNK